MKTNINIDIIEAELKLANVFTKEYGLKRCDVSVSIIGNTQPQTQPYLPRFNNPELIINIISIARQDNKLACIKELRDAFSGTDGMSLSAAKILVEFFIERNKTKD